MPADYVQVDRSKQPGNQLVRLASLLTEARQISDAIVNIGSHTIATTSTNPDYTLLATVFGLNSAGDAEEVATMVTNINDILNSTSTVAGVDRLSQIDEFTGRVGLQ